MITEPRLSVPAVLTDPVGERDVRWRSPGYEVVETSLEVTMYLSPKL
jgi:hypothetical protein